MANASVNLTRMETSPIRVGKTRRTMDIRALTSLPAGRMTPLVAFGLLREDALQTTRISVGFEMMETAELLVNPINVRVMAYLVPNLALDRFNSSMDQLNRSYMGQPPMTGQAVVPFVEQVAFPDMVTDPSVHEIYKYLGKHGKAGMMVSSTYVEAYNQIWNFRAKNRSPDLTLRGRLDTTLAPAFWYHEQFAFVVPEFQQAIIDGAVPLNVTAGALPVKGLGLIDGGTGTAATTTLSLRETGNTASTPNTPGWVVISQTDPAAPGMEKIGIEANTVNGWPNVFAEMAENGITVSLSNIELARKTQAFALLRQQYNQLEDDFIIDLLMQGIHIPEQDMTQPILLGQTNTIFGMSKRYASDGANLTESVVNGLTQVDLSIRCPPINTGGTVMVVCEILPEQLWERQCDPYLETVDVVGYPDYLRDTLDPEKVEIVTNAMIDCNHTVPTGVFGYAPLNWRWLQGRPEVGGKFYRASAGTEFDEDRQRIWAVETVDPTLSESFYIATNIHTKPFVVQDADPFEATTRGAATIVGNTVFGPRLIEGQGDYEAIAAKAPMDRIDQAPPAALEANNA